MWVVTETGATAAADGEWLEWSEPYRLHPGDPGPDAKEGDLHFAMLVFEEEPKPSWRKKAPWLAEHEVEPDTEAEREELGARLPQVKRAPLAPTQRQRALHDLTHTRFKSWCRACVSGRGRRAPHTSRNRDGEPRGHEVSADFRYLRKRQNKFVAEPEDEDEVEDPREPTAADQVRFFRGTSSDLCGR